MGTLMHAPKLVQVGKARDFSLPQESLARLQRDAGETVFLSETANDLTLAAYDPVIQDQLHAGRDFVRDYREALRMLNE